MKLVLNLLPESLKNLLRKTNLYKARQIKNKSVVKYEDVDKYLDKAPKIYLRKKLDKKPRVAIVKDKEIFKNYVNPKASWLRYKRFCKNNDIPYGFYDIERSNWIREAANYDIFICHTPSNPSFQDMIESRIYILERFMGKHCFPNFHEVWQYENKNRANFLYQIYNLPTIPTTITYSKKEALELIKDSSYPFITKTTIGASSSGVTKIDTPTHAKKQIDAIFSSKGLRSQFPYYKQKDYFYKQEFIDDATYDLRIILVDKMAFGYYRYPNKGDFRASGAGNTEKKAIPKDALRLAVDIRKKLNSRQMGVDLLYSEKNGQYYIIETSLFNQIDTPEQLVVDSIAGYYDISDIDNIVFREGKFWIQELAIREVIEEWSYLQ